jgi:hypothetical protein
MKSRIERFATKHRLKTRIDREDGTTIIPGKNGRRHIYEYADGVLAFILMPAKKSSQWSFLLAKLVAPAFRIVQNGDFEGACIFDHQNEEAIRLVRRVCRIHARRNLSAETLDRLRKTVPRPTGRAGIGLETLRRM